MGIFVFLMRLLSLRNFLKRFFPLGWPLLLSLLVVSIALVLPLTNAEAKDAKAPAPAAERISPGKIDFCRAVYGCNLKKGLPFCPPLKELGKAEFTFDSTRCLEARLLDSRGVGPDDPVVGFRLYRFLGMEYRVIYNVTDSIKISHERLEYLLNDLPLAARLISFYQKSPYTAKYLDSEHLHFEGTKGKRLYGDARLISGALNEKRLFYFGTGTAEVAFWTLKGPALMDFIYSPTSISKYVVYKMKLLVFPGNSIINKIMNLGLFRKIVFGKIRDVLIDITETAKKLQESNGKDLLKSPQWSDEEKKKIETFLRLP